MIWVTSDCHFYHKNIIEYENRPFKDVNEMNYEIIKRWNKKVKPDDQVYILGDFILTNNREKAKEIIAMLNGNKYLILGNHDKVCQTKELQKLFEDVKVYHTLNYKHKYIVLFHYPILCWNRKYYGAIHLYGHNHNSWNDNKIGDLMKNSYNVSMDLNNYEPVLLDDIIEKLSVDRDSIS